MNSIPQNIVKTQGAVFREDRERLLNQTASTIWITGLSASGKSTIAYALERALFDKGRLCYVLDGDNVRHGLNCNLGFSAEDRTENIRRVAEVAKLMNDAGVIVITAFISPFAKDRELARDAIGTETFKEIYLNTPIETCEGRDPKGLYRKARAGEIKDFTGVQSPYEAPEFPSLVIDTSRCHIDEAVQRILLQL
ncbi:adenylyl-sulfate kinase [Chitiniphilus shinanonensis]|uniref:Adenylyl-sulfate kinase n=1 Tax=Chitiniphilus shinanonensis TaxID=553088 RepID=A0ABQ6BUE2_9NEIS|nr:adenylyl-sulfate kinase [Chitiniphilus shinanonensis]GLS03832.1 adenylyl-sulfate kinase [Chitiniphilus shinanonensis]